jgi:hypothetical protein
MGKKLNKLRENSVPASYSPPKNSHEINRESAVGKWSIVAKTMTGPSHTGSDELVEPTNVAVSRKVYRISIN